MCPSLRNRNLVLVILSSTLLLACGKPASTDRPLSVTEALAECQSTVEGAAGLNAKNISEKDVASGYSISGFILDSCMAKHRYQCVQGTSKEPCKWIPMQ